MMDNGNNSKRFKFDIDQIFNKIISTKTNKTLRKIKNENLDVDYGIIFSKNIADEIFQNIENCVEYYSGDLTKVKIFGKWHQIPRQQVAYGDQNLKYTFSGNTIPAKPWPEILKKIRDFLVEFTGHFYNFVLVNRYRDGIDHIGEHRDDEKELDKNTPIASISFGQTRTFVLKHRDARKSGVDKKNIASVKIDLEHGSLLLMNHPTNEVWYHSVPQRKSVKLPRINLTFRKINM